MLSEKIELSVTDLEIKVLEKSGREILALRSNVSFNEKIVERAKELGVEYAYKKEEEKEEEE